MKQVIVYQCDYCKRLFYTKKGAEKHEPECAKNPVGINCFNCRHIDRNSSGITEYCKVECESVFVLKQSSAGGHRSCAPLCQYFELFDGTNGYGESEVEL